MSKRSNARRSENSGNNESQAQSAADTSTESGATEAQAAPDPFESAPVTRIGDDVEFSDFSAMPTADPRKYTNVNSAAVADRLPTVKGWKYERAMLTPGTNRKEFKQGSVYGNIQAIVQAAGRGGIPAYVVATMLRREQVGNKRSHYCTSGDSGALPPVGWAEGWINTAITKNIAGVHPTKQAPALREEVTEGEDKAKASAEQRKLAAQG